jgi:glycosyltransferase involved in cell wall biosynthesis
MTAVTFVSPHAQLGGAERYLETLFEQLGPEWIRSLVTLQDGPAIERFRKTGHEPHVIPTGPSPLSMLAASWRLRRLVRQHRPDVIHANGIKAALVALPAAGRTPVVWLKPDFAWDGLLTRLVARLCSRVIGVSEAVTESLPRRANVAVVRLGITPPAVNRNACRVQLCELLGAPADAPVVALLGRLHPVKGHHELLAAVPDLLRRVPELRVALIGGDDAGEVEYGRSVRERIEALGLGDRVKLLGFVNDALALVAGADVLVVPSVADEQGRGKEGGSFATVEAMALGTVVVGYGHGGLPEVVGDTGLLVPPGDRRALGEAIFEMLTDPERRARLAEAARRRAAERFSLERNTEALKDHYRAVARRP